MTPWPDEAAAQYVTKGYWEGRGLADHIYGADVAADAICLVDGPVRMSYRELFDRADGAARGLRELGLRPDDRVVIQLPNCWEFVVTAVACFRLGVVPVMALPAHRHREIASVAAHTEAKALIVPDAERGFDHQEMARTIAGDLPCVEHILVAGTDVRAGNVDLRALCEPAADAAAARRELDASAPDGAAPALFLLSGGTTGLPKLIARTHNDYAFMVKQAVEICQVGPDTVYLAALPLAHGFTMAGPGALGALMSGGRLVIVPSPAPERAFAAIAAEKVTMSTLVPAVVQRWLDYRQAHRDIDLGSLRLLQVGGAHLPSETARRVAPTLGCTLQQAYGMSEGLFCLTRPGDPADVVCHTQGRPICPDDELLLVDGQDRPVASHEPGSLLTRGPYTTRGYYRAADLNKEAFTPDGWYRTGDIVRKRPDGNLVVEGRVKDVINRGGEKIHAGELEEAVQRIAGVRLAAAVAMPDAALGERVCLFVVPVPGHEVTLPGVRSMLEHAGVAGYKIPERLVIVDELPVTGVGKADKKVLRAEIAALLAREADEAAGEGQAISAAAD